MNFRYCSRSEKPFFACKNHAHKKWEMICQITGKTRAIVGNVEFEMCEGDVIVIPPDTIHRTESDVYITDMWISFEKCDFPSYPFVVSDGNGNIKKLFEIMFKICEEGDQENIAEKLFELICLFVKKAHSEKNIPEIVGIVKRKLEENVENCEFDVSDYIVSLGYNTDYFRRLYKTYTSVSPFVYLNNLRMERAKNLLIADPFFNVREIASLCGFKESLYFSTCFKKYTGISPSQYKKTNKL